MKTETEISHEHVMKVNFKWKIEKFNQISTGKTSKDKIVSPSFSMGPNEEFTWSIQLYPKGTTVGHKTYLSVYLILIASTESKIKVHYKFTILNRKKNLPVFKSTDGNFSLGECHGYKQFVKADILRNLEDDSLILQAELSVRNAKTNVNKIKMIDYLRDLFENKNHSDAVLIVEKKEFKIHKCILASRSQYFASLFQHDMIEKDKNSVEIKDISQEVMYEILRFAYTGDIENLKSIAKDLLAAANKFLFEDLKTICEAELYNSLTVENAVELLTFAEMHNSSKLKDQALDFLVQNINEVKLTASMKEMTNYPELQNELILKMSEYMQT